MSAAAHVFTRRGPASLYAADPPQAAGGHSAVHRLADGSTAKLDLVTTREAFDALEFAWTALFERSGRDTQLFQTFNWLWHWANHFLASPGETGVRLAIVTAHINDRLVMVWPLVSDRVGPVTRLSWMGEPASQYGDVLIDDVPHAAELLGAGLDFVIRETEASVLQLRKVRQDSVVAPLLAERGARIVSELTAPYLDLASAPTFDDYEKRYSSNARRNRKRQRRRLDERGAITLDWHVGGREAEALTAIAFDLKRVWLRQRGLVSPALSDPRTALFFADATGARSHPAGCHVLVLNSGGKPVALEIGVRCKGRTAIHIIVYDLAYEKTAAGSLLMEDSIRRASNDGVKVFDMLAPGDGYKLEWSDAAVVVRDWALPLSFAGRVYSEVYLGLIRTAAKRGLDLLPPGARLRVADGLVALRSGVRRVLGRPVH